MLAKSRFVTLDAQNVTLKNRNRQMLPHISSVIRSEALTTADAYYNLREFVYELT